MKKRVVSVICMMSLLFSSFSGFIPAHAMENSEGHIIEDNDVPLRLHYDEEAPYEGEGLESIDGITSNDGWEKWSLPIGNGYFGVNVFGRTETERLQITEKTLSNPYYRTNPEGKSVSLGGLNNFSETYIDIGHPFQEVTDYSRWLDLETAISGVSYNYNGVTYSREVFTSYPDKALVIRLDASEEGKLSFVLRPTVPWQQEYASWEGDGASKTGNVTSYLDGNDGIVELSGKMGYYDIDFLGLYRVVTNGGTVTATTTTNEYGNTDGTITVTGATSAYVYVNLGTDYELSEEMFLTESDKRKPTFNTTLEDTRRKVGAEFDAIAEQLAGKSFEDAYAVLKNNHLDDYTELFGRVSVDLGDNEDAELTTDALLTKYKSGTYSRYLEMLYFQYGRYLLIASSRPGTLVANLQGTWNRYNKSPWGSGIWHNINVQMNYWPAFSTNIAETFEAYVGYNAAYMPAAEKYASDMVKRYNNALLDEDGGNGWCIGTGAFPYYISGDRSAGNLGFTTQLYWEYYEYTRDKTLLEEVVFPILVSAARYIVKTVELTADGKYLVSHCDSPEMYVNGVWYYTKGTTYAQSFAYQNNYNALLAAKELGIDLTDSALLETEELSVFNRLMEQLDKYDPIIVGLSGQVKEFREEDYYASVADDPHHRHISQLVGLYPGNIINSTTPAWLDAAKVTLTERGDNATGWGIAHRLNLWARTKDGDRTYKVLNTLLSTSTVQNLWDMHPPFQIDGNLGGTAGISEMLLQSHEGYIAPLAAIPEAWDSGSYTGLVARGNFEVSAEWENGLATCFNITSKVGGEVSVNYGGITSATVIKASNGRKVNYTVSGTDLITFDTEVGETYIISGFKISPKLAAPKGLELDRTGFGQINLNWNAVEGAVSYRVYLAIESQPDYTLIGTTTETYAVYIPKGANVNARMTFKIVPVNSDGVEGKGALAYQNPIDVDAELDGYEAYAFENGELQVTVKSSENTLSYRLWKMAEGESDYTLVTESPYPIIIHEGYDEAAKYAISLVSNALRTESELYELANIRNATEGSDGSSAVWYTNLLSDMEFTKGEGATSIFGGNTYGYHRLTDGLYDKDADGKVDYHSGRFATTDQTGACLDGIINFGSSYILDELRIYDYLGGTSSTRLGDRITVHVKVDGEWRVAASLNSRSEIKSAKKADMDKGLYYVSLNLGGTVATGIRVVCKNETNTEGITLYEITCSGAKLGNTQAGGADEDNILEGKLFTGDKSPIAAQYGYQTLTDGDFGLHTGRFAVSDTTYSKVTMECALGDLYKLYALRIYDHADNGVTRSKETTVEVYYCGEWVKIVDALPLASGSSRLKDNTGKEYTLFDLGGAKAEKIRITCNNTSGEAKGISLYEIKCSASKVAESSDRNIIAESTSATLNTTVAANILKGKEFKPNGDAGSYVFSATYGYPKMTDGIFNKDANGAVALHLGRFSTKSITDMIVDGTVDLGAMYNLGELRIYDYATGKSTRLGNNVEVQVYNGTEWISVYRISGEQNIFNSKIVDKALGLDYLPVDLSGYAASKIRLQMSSSADGGITFYEVTCSGTRVDGQVETDVSKKHLTAADIATLTDGKTDTAITLPAGSFPAYYYEFDLGDSYSLHTLNIRDVRAATDLVGGQAATRSNDTYVEVYVEGRWIRIINGASLSVTNEYTSFDLYGLRASKIRIGFNNTQTFDDGTTPPAVISEISCSVSTASADKKPLLEAYKTLAIIADGDATYVENMKKFREYMTEFLISEADVEKFANEIIAYSATLLDGAHTAHSIKQYEGKAPTCNEQGWYSYEKCELCDYTTYESILMTGHTSDESEWEHDADYHWRRCSECGEIDEESKAEHVFVDDTDTTCDCGYERGHQHVYNKTNSDANNHWLECSCGEIDENSVTAHVYESGCDAECDCGYVRAELTHDYTLVKYDGTHHWLECSCGAIDESSISEHVYSDALGEECDCGYKKTHQHIYTNPKHDESSHWLECFCGEIEESSVTAHVFENACDTTCDCGYERVIAHDYIVTDHNTFNHWNKCSVCGTIDEDSVTAHTYSDVCDTTCECGYERVAPHDYTADNYNNAYHWKECSFCGDVKQSTKTSHQFGAWTVTVQPTNDTVGEEKRVCSGCEYYEVREIAALGYIEEFRAAVNALSLNKSTKDVYADLYAALALYAKLTDAEKAEASEEFATLQTAINTYNTRVDNANTTLTSATEIAFAPLTASVSFLAALWFLIKKKFFTK